MIKKLICWLWGHDVLFYDTKIFCGRCGAKVLAWKEVHKAKDNGNE